VRESEVIENTVLGKKLTKDASIPALVSRILKIAKDDSSPISASAAIGWRDLKFKEIARLTRILRKKINA
jgi:hypothetical protein